MSIKAIKIETEAEGASWEQIEFVKELADEIDTPLYLKIGGVEAKTDIRRAKELGIAGVIAPMVESTFALEKFDEATANLGFEWRALTIESITAMRDLEAITIEAKSRGIDGLTLGRGDFSASLGLKGSEDSPEVNEYVKYFIDVVKDSGLHVSIGGNVTIKSIDNLAAIRAEANFLETRRVIFPWHHGFEKINAEEIFAEAIDWEIQAIEKMNVQSLGDSLANLERVRLLKSRLKRP